MSTNNQQPELPFTKQEVMDGISAIYKEWCLFKAMEDRCMKVSLPDFEKAMKDLAKEIGAEFKL
jgi:hypothetical protein